MKNSLIKAAIVGLSLSGFTLLGCSNTQPDPRIEKLEKRMDTLEEALKYKGFDLEQIVKEMEIRNKAHDIPVDGSATSGPEKAEVTLVEFSDFECPYCARTAPMVKALQDKYPDRVKVIFKHFPLSFHRKAPAAHAASRAAQNQGKFWEFRYLIAPHFKDLTPERYIAAAEQLGLDMDKFKEDMKVDGEDLATFQKDMALGSKVGVRGTPTYYVNGKLTQGDFGKVVEDLLNAKK